MVITSFAIFFAVFFIVLIASLVMASGRKSPEFETSGTITNIKKRQVSYLTGYRTSSFRTEYTIFLENQVPYISVDENLCEHLKKGKKITVIYDENLNIINIKKHS
jgi:hypothetical protein